jgi:hypothetical protein
MDSQSIINNNMPLTTAFNVVSSQTFPHQEINKESPTKKILILLTIIVLLLISGGVGFYFLFLKPKMEAISFSKNLQEKMLKVVSALSEVDQSINKIYSLITKDNQSADEKLLLQLNVGDFLSRIKTINQKGQVAGVTTKKNLNEVSLFLENMAKVNNNLKNTSFFGGIKKDVLGEQTLEPKLISALRKVKEVSGDSLASSKKGLAKLEEIKEVLKDRPKNLKLETEIDQIISKLEKINDETTEYFSEASKTANYYYKMVEIRIELTPFLNSYASFIREIALSSTPQVYLGRLEELKNTISKINSNILLIKEEDLPSGIKPLHEDNLKTIEIIKNNVNDVKKAIENKSYLEFLNAILVLQQDIEPLTTRAVTLELNFWQNNKALKNASNLKKLYQEQENLINDFIKKNKLPLINA